MTETTAHASSLNYIRRHFKNNSCFGDANKEYQSCMYFHWASSSIASGSNHTIAAFGGILYGSLGKSIRTVASLGRHECIDGLKAEYYLARYSKIGFVRLIRRNLGSLYFDIADHQVLNYSYALLNGNF